MKRWLLVGVVALLVGCGSDVGAPRSGDIKTTEFTNQAGQHCTQLVSSNALALDCTASSSR